MHNDNNNLFNRAINLYKLKKYKKSIEYFDKILESDPNNIDAYKYKGDILSCLDRYEESIECYNKIL